MFGIAVIFCNLTNSFIVVIVTHIKLGIYTPNGSYSFVSQIHFLSLFASLRMICLHVSSCPPVPATSICSVILAINFSSIFLIASLVKRSRPASLSKSFAVISSRFNIENIILSPMMGLNISARSMHVVYLLTRQRVTLYTRIGQQIESAYGISSHFSYTLQYYFPFCMNIKC